MLYAENSADHGGTYQLNRDFIRRNIGPRIERYGRSEFAASSFFRSKARLSLDADRCEQDAVD
jgi:hypothetical protein